MRGADDPRGGTRDVRCQYSAHISHPHPTSCLAPAAHDVLSNSAHFLLKDSSSRWSTPSCFIKDYSRASSHAWSQGSLYPVLVPQKAFARFRAAPSRTHPSAPSVRPTRSSLRPTHSSVNYALFSSLAPLTGTTTSPSSSRAGSASACCCRGEVCILQTSMLLHPTTLHLSTTQ